MIASLLLIVAVSTAEERPRRVRVGNTQVTVVDEPKSRQVDEVFSRLRHKKLKRQQKQQIREQRLSEKAERQAAKQRARTAKAARRK